MEHSIPLRHCNKCGNDWPPTAEFWYLDKRRGTWRTACKQCCKHEPEQHRAWRLAHRDDLLEYNRLYGKVHHDERASYRRTHRAEHTAWYSRYEQKRNTLPQRKAQHTANSRNRHARKKNAIGTHTAQQVQEQHKRQNGRCYYCRCKVRWGEHHVDHVIPLSRGGSNDISNLVITCPSCNLKKHAKMPHEWPEGGRLL